MKILKSDPVFRYFTNDLNFEYCNFWGEGVKEIDPELEEEKKPMLCLCVSIHFLGPRGPLRVVPPVRPASTRPPAKFLF